MAKTSQEKVAVIDSINKNNTLQDEDKLFLVHQGFQFTLLCKGQHFIETINLTM